MKKIKFYTTLSGVCGLALCFVSTNVSHADSEIKIKHSVKGQYTYIEDDDLDTAAADARSSETLEYKASVSGELNEDFSFYTEARALKNYGEAGSIDSETGESTGREDFVELRQYWIEYDGLAEYLPFSLRAGRQRIREERSLWWNRDFDGVSLIYDATIFNGFLTVGENMVEYRSSGDSFQEDDQGIFRVLGQTSWQWQKDNFLEARIAFQDDHSDHNNVGYVLEEGDRDDEDSDLFWAGLRAQGQVPVPTSGVAELISYRADVIGLVGEQDNELTSSNGDGTRTVTGYTTQDVRAWGLDVGLDITIPVGSRPILSVGYAHGSGDDNASDDEDHNFRQTGLDGNTSRLVGSGGSFYNYGSVLRPDLANIHILTAGLGVPVLKDSNIGFIYHYYQLDEDATSLSTSGITAPLNGTDKELGHGMDLVLDFGVSEEFGITQKGFDKIGLKTTVGGFSAGDAYGTAEGEFSYRAQVDLSFRF